MTNYLRIRRLALKYKKLCAVKEELIKLSQNKKSSANLYLKYKKVTSESRRDIRRLLNYIELYEVIFEHSLNMLDSPFEKKITEILCKEGRSVESTAARVYLSSSTVDRIFKRFVIYFFNNLDSSQRIIKPLLEIKKL